MQKFKKIIDEAFGENYSSTYFDGDELKLNFKMIRNENALLIYSSTDNMFYLNLIIAKERGKGYANNLLNTFRDIISSDFYVETWLYEGNRALIKWIEQNGGEIIKVVPKFWFEDSLAKKYSCSLCGQPCQCTMILYRVKNNPTR